MSSDTSNNFNRHAEIRSNANRNVHEANVVMEFVIDQSGTAADTSARGVASNMSHPDRDVPITSTFHSQNGIVDANTHAQNIDNFRNAVTHIPPNDEFEPSGIGNVPLSAPFVAQIPATSNSGSANGNEHSLANTEVSVHFISAPGIRPQLFQEAPQVFGVDPGNEFRMFLNGHNVMYDNDAANQSLRLHNGVMQGHRFTSLEELIQHLSFVESNSMHSRPAAAAIVESLPTVTIPESNENNNGGQNHKECCICMCEFEPGERVTTMPCGHCYHSSCIKQWLDGNNTCPVCRETLATENDVENDEDPSSNRI